MCYRNQDRENIAYKKFLISRYVLNNRIRVFIQFNKVQIFKFSVHYLICMIQNNRKKFKEKYPNRVTLAYFQKFIRQELIQELF